MITPELVAQADEIRRNYWDYHPTASLPEDRSLVAYPDGIWIVEAGCLLNQVTRYARVADSWRVLRAFGGIQIMSDGHGEIPIPEGCAHAALRLLSVADDTLVAEVPAPAGGWNHAGLAVALAAQREAVVDAQRVRAMLGETSLGTSEHQWALPS